MSYVHEYKQGPCEAVNTAVEKKAAAQALKGTGIGPSPRPQDYVAVSLYKAQNCVLLCLHL